MRIYLIGFMGSGKSTAGKKLAAKMHLPFMDIDKNIEAIENAPVTEVFAKKGETYFRQLESDVLHDTTIYNDAIISCGGGTPCFLNNMEWIKQNGVSIYLKCNHNFLFSRLEQKKAKRPLIANMNEIQLKKYIIEKLGEREKFYNQADIIISAEELDIEALIIILENYLKFR